MAGDRYAGEEHPHNHSVQLALFVAFLPLWVIESFFLKLSTFGYRTMVLPRIGVAIALFLVGAILMDRSHKALFDNPPDVPQIISTGVFRWTRHPMYSGALLAYLSLVIAVPSILCLAILCIGFLAFDRLAAYEEEDLLKNFGDEYRAYQRRVSRWVPFLF